MKSNRQARYARNWSNKKFNHHRYTPIPHIQYKDEFILCFGELYAVFARVFAGGNTAPHIEYQDFPTGFPCLLCYK